MDQLNENHLCDVYRSVYGARAKWYNIGLELGIPSSELDTLRAQNGEDALREVLKHWLQQIDPPPTWGRLLEALRSPTVGKQQLALELERDPQQAGIILYG